MAKKKTVVRTIYLQKFFDPGREMVEARQNIQDTQALIKAMRRLELADQTLERELKPFSEKGFTIDSIVQHPRDNAEEHDLLVTLILSKDAED
jgi:hypothetical protein